MIRSRQSFTPEFKARAVRIVVDTHRSVASVARELNIHEQTLRNWVNRYRRQQMNQPTASVPQPPPEPARHPEHAVAHRERDFLAAAARTLTVEQCYELIETQRLASSDGTAVLPVPAMCALLGVSRSGYDQRRSRTTAPARPSTPPRHTSPLDRTTPLVPPVPAISAEPAPARPRARSAAPAPPPRRPGQPRHARPQRRSRRPREVLAAAAALGVVLVVDLLGFSALVASDAPPAGVTPAVASAAHAAAPAAAPRPAPAG